MTAAEQARAEVEAWALQWRNPPHFDLMHTGWLRDLIARLTPVFERAALQNETDAERYGKELRERAERAEAREVKWSGMCKNADKRADAAEADVARLREATTRFLQEYALSGFVGVRRLHQALADTEPCWRKV